MISKKDKYLESAQKFIIKGQLDKAVKDLEQAISFDPRDIKVRQRMAELLVRLNRQEEAISEYETIGKFFSDSGFYLRAIAVYKQIQKLAPDKPKTTLTLGELNVKQGLVGNALAEFNQLVNLHVKNGNFSDAIEVLQRMIEIDSGNANTMLKLAETFYAAGDHDKAYVHYMILAQHLFNRTDKSPLHRIGERIRTLFPEKKWSVLSFAAAQLERGEHNAALASLKEIISSSPDNIEAWYLLADTIRAMGEMGQFRQALIRISQRFPKEFRPFEELIDLAIANRDSKTAIELLKGHRAHLLASDRATQVEHFYAQIETLDSQSVDVVEGLRWLYNETSDAAKLQLLDSRIASVSSPAKPEELSLKAEEIVDTEPATGATIIRFETEPGPEELLSEQEPEWEEEITLDIDEEAEERLPRQVAESMATEIEASFEPQTLEAVDLGPIQESLEQPEESLGREVLPTPAEISADEEPPESIDITESMLGLQESDRITLTIQTPLTFEAFLPPPEEAVPKTVPAVQQEPPQLEEHIETPPPEATEQKTEPDLVSLWEQSIDEALADEPEEQPTPAEISMSLSEEAMHPEEAPILATFDAAEVISTEEASADSLLTQLVLETEILEDQSSEDHMEIESILGDEDLAIFSEALFGQEEDRSEDQGKYGLGDLLTAFKKGVDEQLDESDTESHYSLGIAYKEMGLYDEAVEEFRSAARDSSRSADCSCLEGLCWRDKGDQTAAERAFKEGLALPVISAEALLNLKYELAMLYELSDRTEEAISLYSEIMHANIYFRDVSDRLANLADNGDLDILEPELLELDEEH